MNSTAAVITIARCMARQAIEDQIRAQGRRLWDLPAGDIRKAADAYLASHRAELCAEALANILSRAQRKRR
jgi:hypothetical protein